MCGIAGFISSDKIYDTKKIVGRMLDVMHYRGYDQYGIGVYDDVTLGMLRLSIIDKSEHELPYTDENKKYTIVYNGEIYNHDEIRKSLNGKYRFKTHSDAETAIYNYIEKGVRSFDEYNGMYAFAIYDSQTKTTYIVRDKSGEKPVYYHHCEEYFIFASEIKALIEVVKPIINEDACSYKAYEFLVGSETLFKDIYSLEPGEYLEIHYGKYKKYDYWKVWDNIIEVKDDEKIIISELTELVEDAIYLRTKNCVHQYGCFISGGVDSSLVACIAKPDFLYYVHYDYDDFDEMEYAQLVAKKINKNLIVVRPTKEDFQLTREKIAFHLDTPCTWTSFSLWMLLENAKKNLKVIMTGDGADELFSGYHRYHLLNHDEQIYKLDAMKQYAYMIDRYYGSPVDRYAKLINRYENPLDEAVNQYLKEKLTFYFNKANGDIIHAMGINDFYTTMQVLLQMSDRLSMAFTIENRSPFLDYRLIQYAFSMPSKYKIRYGTTKWILKELAKKFIPMEIVHRIDKRGFSAPVNRWFEWDKQGKYDRGSYRKLVYDDWKRAFFNDKNKGAL
ncbi:MAG: asparagine synthase (glutamine-hydrolyzing) [Nitrospirae bacterium]|nr:asparagine synthase (glutamine-hydrolyzing) [Nitrospirota bacterium]